MATTKLPAYILKDTTIVAGGHNRIGQCRQITIAVLEKSLEEFRNAGMIKPREVSMGYNATRTTFTETAFDPDMLALFVNSAGGQTMIAYGYLEDEDGSEHTARFEMTADLTRIDPGNWATGEKAETELSNAVHEGRLFIDDEEIFAFDDFEFSVRGERQQPGRRAALRMV